MVHEALNELKMPNYAKTSGARGIHVYVPIVRGPTQKQVWYFAKEFARSVAAVRPQLMTTEYSVAKRPPRHVLVDYNQNAWGRTLAAVYSVRPRPRATVSTPCGGKKSSAAFASRTSASTPCLVVFCEIGDLWAPLLAHRGRFRLEALL